jgi:gamma-glutamylcyclotransferase (GGCT)/AIG2-like uncharacterized protein YtfP
MPLLFSYGTLQYDDVQRSTFGRLLRGEPDELLGYHPSSVKIENAPLAAALGRTHHANATFSGDEKARVPGTVYEVSDAELARADEFEAPFSYKRVTALLASGRHAWVYVHAAPAHSVR